MPTGIPWSGLTALWRAQTRRMQLALAFTALGVALHPIVGENDLLAPVALDTLHQPAVGNALEPGVLEQGPQEQKTDHQQQDVDQRRAEPRPQPGLLVQLLAARIRLADHSPSRRPNSPGSKL